MLTTKVDVAFLKRVLFIRLKLTNRAAYSDYAQMWCGLPYRTGNLDINCYNLQDNLQTFLKLKCQKHIFTSTAITLGKYKH